eukprot:747600_1
MCGKCKSGFSESMTSVSCVQCKHGIYIAYILYPMMFALLWTAYITLSSSDKVKSDKKKQTEHKRCAQVRDLLSNDRFMTLFKTMWNRNIMYYEQALSQILASGSLVALGTGFAEVFNFSITNNNSSDDDNLWCFVDGLDAKQKILLDLLMPLFIVLFIAILYLVSTRFCDGELVLFEKRRINFRKACVCMMLLLIGNILSVLFRLLACIGIGDHSYHFYFGFEQCYGVTWVFSLVSLIFVVIVFSVVFIKLRAMDCEEREDKENTLNQFVNKYKTQYYYWEYVLFLRRTCIAVFAVSVKNIANYLIFLSIIGFFTFIQHKCAPFVIESCNTMEFILLLFLILVLEANILSSADTVFEDYFVSCLILLPFVFMIYFMCYGVATEEEHVLGDVLDNGVKTNTIKQIQLSSTQGHQIEEKRKDFQ